MLIKFENWFIPADKVKWVKVRKTLFGYYQIVVKCGWRRYRGNKWLEQPYVVSKAIDFVNNVNKLRV